MTAYRANDIEHMQSDKNGTTVSGVAEFALISLG